MSALILFGLAVSTLLALGYIIGSELCLPTARHALRTGDMQSWMIACRLVAAGEWAIIALSASLLALAKKSFHLFSEMPGGTLVGLCALGLVIGAALWEISGRTRKHYFRVMSTSLDLVLPASGMQRDRYERLHQRFETGSWRQRQRVLKCLVANIQRSDKRTATDGNH
jgi:hypothetical protein